MQLLDIYLRQKFCIFYFKFRFDFDTVQGETTTLYYTGAPSTNASKRTQRPLEGKIIFFLAHLEWVEVWPCGVAVRGLLVLRRPPLVDVEAVIRVGLEAGDLAGNAVKIQM